MKQALWKSDWFFGLLISIVFIALANTDFILSVERHAYDFGVQSSNRTPSDKIAIIAIDNESIANIGRWPWSREIHASMHDILAEGGAKVIGQTVFFLEPQIDPGLKFIRQLKQQLEDSSIAVIPEEIALLKQGLKDLHVKYKSNSSVLSAVKTISDFVDSTSLVHVDEELKNYMELLSSADSSLNSDHKLAESLQATGNVIIAIPFIPGEALGKPDKDLPEYISINRLPTNNIHYDPNTNLENSYPVSMADTIVPVTAIGEQAIGIGSLVSLPDVDGAIRAEPLVINYYDDFYPSMALLLAAKSLNMTVEDINVSLGTAVTLGNLKITTDSYSLMNTFFYNSEPGKIVFPVDSFFDVLQGKIPPGKYRNKIVLIGATAYGVGDTMVTPINPTMPPVVSLAHSVSSILNEDFFVEPEWASYARFGAIALIALYLMFVLPRLGAAVGFTITLIFFSSLFATHYMMMTTQGMWLQLMLPALLLVGGHLLLTTKNFLLAEEGKAKLDIESAESNRMLGLSLQGQGQLDMAFEKFRKLPIDKSVLELMYNLALDYERKRQFNKARSAYDYMAEYDSSFRDISERSKRARAMDETVMLGSTSTAPGGTLVFNDSGVERPMLGRYEVERELGKGAMGSVYLGKDPKISRVVAIKTMALSQEFGDDELEEVKQRFFREAETAGRLTHPNIVTIYDAGEEHDLAYIAMEFLKGTDLTEYIKKGSLLPYEKVLMLIRKAADALDYAHSNNVVHRDIKPANLMYDGQTDTLKITDFGIARITDTSKTKTGMVLGTPSYMSPEQLSGKKVDGQSDLFSLGVMLFQMVTGSLPFTGDSMATLMYKIANDPHPAPESINDDLPRCITVIINRALEKDIEKRYKTGAQMITDIDKCIKILGTQNQVNKT